MPMSPSPRPRTVRVARAVLTAALVVALAGALTPARAGVTHQVDIVGFAFDPPSLTITVGDTVTWTNLDAAVHTATSTTGAFDSGDLDQNESWSFTFTTPGTYDYLCTPHPFMTGTIVVEAVAAAPTPAPTVAPAAPTAAPAGGGLPNVAMRRDAGVPLVPIGVLLVVGGIALAVRRRSASNPRR